MSRAIRDRVEQEAVQRRSTSMGMMEKASDLTPPDLPLTLEECPQTDPGILTGDRSNLRGISCSGPQKRDLRLLECGQSEKDLWRGAPATIRRRGTQLLAGSVGSMDQIVKLIETPIALMKKPDNCTPEIYNAYLTVQPRARNGVGLKIEQMDKHLRGVIKKLVPEQDGRLCPGGISGSGAAEDAVRQTSSRLFGAMGGPAEGSSSLVQRGRSGFDNSCWRSRAASANRAPV